jgi:hypothetical protein
MGFRNLYLTSPRESLAFHSTSDSHLSYRSWSWWNKTPIFLFDAQLSLFFFGGEEKAATIKLRNERGVICISAHPEVEKLEEQRHNAQHAHTQFLLACACCSLNYGD